MLRPLALLLSLLLLPTGEAIAEQWQDRAGDLYQVRLERVSETAGDGSSGNSRDVWTLTERVVALHEANVELEFDLPQESSAADRARSWQFPARVLLSPLGALQLLNETDLEARVGAWLQSGGLTREMCGRWIFTWTAIKIECDPQSVLGMAEPFVRPNALRNGAPYSEIGMREPGLLQESRGTDGATFGAELQVDPDAVRRQRAETDVAVAEMLGDAPLTLETALEAHAAEQISGTLVVTFEADSDGRVTRKTSVATLEIVDEHGSRERVTTTQTIDWLLLSLSLIHI